MTYTKPKDVTYTQMAMWIDNTSDLEQCDHTKLYEYIYHICYMLAKQRDYFTASDMYDAFCLYCASRTVTRLVCSPHLPRIKYILKYLKISLHGYRIRFLQEEYGNVPENVSLVDIDAPLYVNSLEGSFPELDMIEFSVALSSIDRIIKDYLKKLPQKRNSAEWYNIYMSCLLTLLDSITLTNAQKIAINKKDNIETIYKNYAELRNNSPILFHLDNSMSGYIQVLVNQLRRVISTELSWKTNTHYGADATMQNILLKDLEED